MLLTFFILRKIKKLQNEQLAEIKSSNDDTNTNIAMHPYKNLKDYEVQLLGDRKIVVYR
jgi:hypothetical protein